MIFYSLSNSVLRGWLSTESQPQNSESRNNSENFHLLVTSYDTTVSTCLIIHTWKRHVNLTFVVIFITLTFPPYSSPKSHFHNNRGIIRDVNYNLLFLFTNIFVENHKKVWTRRARLVQNTFDIIFMIEIDLFLQLSLPVKTSFNIAQRKSKIGKNVQTSAWFCFKVS